MHKISTRLIIIGISLIIVSIFLFIQNIYDENIAGVNSASVLKVMNEVVDNNTNINTNKLLLENKEEEIMETINISGYDYIGKIIIPTLNLELPIMSEYDYDRLKIAPCRYYGSIKTQNLIICAHSYKTHFKYLNKLNYKDKIIITDTNGINYIYEVLEIEILESNDISKMIDNEYDLTLYTCTNDGLKRVTVRCNLIQNENI